MSGEFIVRRAEERDSEACADLYIAVAAEGRWIGGELPLDRDKQITQRNQHLGDERVARWVAEADGEIMGELFMEIRGGKGWLGMEIAPGWRGKGVGTALMEACIAEARARSLDKIFLEVWPHNEAAIALYEKVGFGREGYHPKHYRRKSGEAWDAISMGLVLRE